MVCPCSHPSSFGSLYAVWELSLVVGSVGFRCYFDPGYLGRPLWPADSSGRVGSLPCLPRSRRFIGGPLALLVEVSVSLQSWQAIGFVFPASLCLLGGPGPVGPLMFALFFSVALSPVGWLVLVVRPFSPVMPSALWSGPSFLDTSRFSPQNASPVGVLFVGPYFIFRIAEIGFVPWFFYFYVYVIYRILIWNPITVSVENSRHAGARTAVMQILRLLVETLGIFHVRVCVCAFASSPDLLNS